jgi:hypothetical protein
MILGLMISSIASGQIIARTGRYRMFPIMGTAFMASGFLLFTFITADKPVWFIMIGMLLVGLGLGQMMQTLTLAGQNSVGPRDIGVATSSSTFFRQIGGTLGVAVIFSVLFSRIPDTIAAAFSNRDVQAGIAAATSDPSVLADPGNTQILELFQRAQNGGAVGDALNGDTSFLNTADPRLAAPFLEGFANATVSVFQVSLIVVLVAFVLSFFLKATPLREKSALQEVADADAAILAQDSAERMGAMVEPGSAATGGRPESVRPAQADDATGPDTGSGAVAPQR